jgi:CheY-like chemotaxis protein
MNSNGKSILVVDDERDIANQIKRSLEAVDGFKACTFTDPFAALEHFNLGWEDHQIVISDIRMPGMNGYEFVKQIKKKIDEADAVLQRKNVTLEAINEYLKLNEELEKHGLSTQDIDKLLNLLLNAREYQFDAKKIVGKLRGIQRLEKKEKQLRGRCEIFTKQAAKYKSILPLVEEISALQIGVEELIAFKIGINQAAKHYDLSPLASTLRLIDDIKKYNKIDGLKKQLSSLYMQKYTVDQVCFSQNKSMMAMLNLQSRGTTEEQIISLSNILIGNQSNLG